MCKTIYMLKKIFLAFINLIGILLGWVALMAVLFFIDQGWQWIVKNGIDVYLESLLVFSICGLLIYWSIEWMGKTWKEAKEHCD